MVIRYFRKDIKDRNFFWERNYFEIVKKIVNILKDKELRELGFSSFCFVIIWFEVGYLGFYISKIGWDF